MNGKFENEGRWLKLRKENGNYIAVNLAHVIMIEEEQSTYTKPKRTIVKIIDGTNIGVIDSFEQIGERII